MAKAADVVVQCLENEGVQYVFGIPGEENLDLLESLRKSQIRLVLTRHEQSAGFMAATYGRLTGKTGVSLSTLGPGATNLVTAGAYAYLGGMPMLMITGQKPIKKSKQGRFQILDVVGMMQPLTKYTHQLASADNIPSRVREAFRLAEEEKPGAVHLELPEDIAAEQTDSLPIPPSLSRRPLAEYKAICAVVEKLRAARSPILVIGAGANRKMTAKVLKQLIDKTGIPFVTTQMGKGVVDERHPRFLGNAALSAGDFVHRAVEAADLIVNVGHDVIEKPPFFMVRGGTEVIHVNFRSAEVDPVYFPQIEVVGDIANAIWQIGEALDDTAHWDFTRLLAIREANEAQVAEGADDPRFPLYPQRLVADVRRALPSQGIVALDNGMYKIWFARNYKAHMPNTVLLDNALATMGAGLPSAMAAHLVYGPADRRGVRRWRLHDEQPGTGNRGAAEDEPDGDHPARQRLRDDPLEAIEHGLRRLRAGLRQPGLRALRRGLRRPRPPGRQRRGLPAAAGALPGHARGACDRLPGGLLGERPHPQRRVARTRPGGLNRRSVAPACVPARRLRTATGCSWRSGAPRPRRAPSARSRCGRWRCAGAG